MPVLFMCFLGMLLPMLCWVKGYLLFIMDLNKLFLVVRIQITVSRYGPPNIKQTAISSVSLLWWTSEVITFFYSIAWILRNIQNVQNYICIVLIALVFYRIRKMNRIWSYDHVQLYVDKECYSFVRGTIIVALTNAGSGVGISYCAFKVPSGWAHLKLLYPTDKVAIQNHVANKKNWLDFRA